MAYPITFNIAKGRAAEMAKLGLANDALIAVVLEATGLVAEATMRDYDTLDAILAGASNEQTTMGRKTLSSVTVTPDDTNDRQDVDAADITWTAASGNPTGLIVICYDYDTTGGTDADIVPLVADSFVTTPSGVDITYQVNAAGFFRAS
jgi:hypothetical protein